MAYSKEALASAVAEATADGCSSVRAVARRYGIPTSTLHDHITGKARRAGAGGVTVLTAVRRTRNCSDLYGAWGHGLWSDKGIG